MPMNSAQLCGRLKYRLKSYDPESVVGCYGPSNISCDFAKKNVDITRNIG